MISNEYTTLVKDGEVVQRILPNEEFDSIQPGCINTAHCTVQNNDKNEILFVLSPGMVTPKLKEVAKQDLSTLTAQALRELCIENGLSFKTKAKKSELLELLGE